MEMPPDSLEAGGVNDLSVAAVVHESVTITKTTSASFGTHRERSSIHFDHFLVFERSLKLHLSSDSRLGQVGGCPHNLPSS